MKFLVKVNCWKTRLRISLIAASILLLVLAPFTARAEWKLVSEMKPGFAVRGVDKATFTAQYGCLHRVYEKRLDANFSLRFWATRQVDIPAGEWTTIMAQDADQTKEMLFCPPGTVEKLIENKKIAPTDVYAGARNPVPSLAGRAAITAINGILYLFSVIGVWLLSITSYFMGLLLGARKFITHPMVDVGWPFVQGVANLGFILALLYIAFATTLRLDIGGGIRRLLPRLLIAALLINFSLVIGAIFIDASRLLMAVIMNVVGAGELTSIGKHLLESSDTIKAVYEPVTHAGIDSISLVAGSDSWAIVIEVLRATILVWGLAIGFAVVTIGLFIRYIMLILLLIVSPLAYLAVALPNMDTLSKQWWSQFLKWTFYGPIALFILVLVILVNNSTENFFGGNKGPGFIDVILTLSITTALCIAAVVAGKTLGGIGGAAAVSYATGAGRRAMRGAGFLARPVGRQVSDAGDVIKSGIRNRLRDSRLTRWAVPARRDEKGKLKPGETSWAQRGARAVMGRTGLDPREVRRRNQANAARAVPAMPGGVVANLDNPAIDPQMLRQDSVLNALGHPNVNAIARNGDINQVKAIARNKDYIRNLSEPERTALRVEINTNVNSTVTAREKSNMINKLYDVFEALDSER